jgi:malate synthase
VLTADDETGVKAGDPFTPALFERLLAEEYEKLLHASSRDVHEVSKHTSLPVAREIVRAYVTEAVKLPWYIDLLNLTLGEYDVSEAKRRIGMLTDAFSKDGTRITKNLDFDVAVIG